MMFYFCSFKLWLCAGGVMQDVIDTSVEAVQLVFLNDDKTPVDFISWLLPGVFAKPKREAEHAVAQICEHGRSAFGPYPPAVAKALLEECQRRIHDAGHPLRIVSEVAAGDTDDTDDMTFAYAC